MRPLTIFVLGMLCGCASPDSPTKFSMFHMPPGGCPEGTTLAKDFFTERDGSKESGCRNPKGNGELDMLKGGESFTMHVVIHEEEGEEKKKI